MRITCRVVITLCTILITCIRTAGLGAGEPLYNTVNGPIVRKWTRLGTLAKALRKTGSDMVLFLDESGSPVKRAPINRSLVSIAFDGSVSISDSTYDYDTLDEPFDIWVTPDGGVYFIHSGISLEGEAQPWGIAIYYLSPKRDRLIRVVDDLKAPVTLIGASDGSTLNVIQKNVEESMLYKIAPDGSLVDGINFVPESCRRC